MDPQEIRQRLGHTSLPPPDPHDPAPIWIHAASVGEVGVASMLIGALQRNRPRDPLVLTTTTRTGQDLARRTLRAPVHVSYVPLDFLDAVRRFNDLVRPSAVVLIETEIWPNLFRETARRGIPILIANGRISDRSLRRYRFIAPLVREALGRVSRACVQTVGDAERFARLGLPKDRIRVTGNVKFSVDLDSSRLDPAPILESLGVAPGDEVWVAGSTAEGEEGSILAAWRTLPPRADGMRVLVLAPRRPERFDAVARLIEEQGLPWRRRTQPGGPSRPSIVLLDTIGELAVLYGRAAVAFVGGTIAPIGGHNILEPAARGVAPIFGPHVENVREAAALLIDARGAFQVSGSDDLMRVFGRLAADSALRREAGERALEVVALHGHALETTLRELTPFLDIPKRGAA